MSDHNGTYYTAHELLEIFKEQHRLSLALDIEGVMDSDIELTPSTSIRDWRESEDLLPWDRLAEFWNSSFRVDIPLQTWESTMQPERMKKLGDVCELLSRHAMKPDFSPVMRFGYECLSAGVFLRIKKNLKGKGVDVDELRPSSEIGPYLERHCSAMIEEITQSGVEVLNKLELGPPHLERRMDRWLDKFIPRYRLNFTFDTGNIRTFRDLVQKIIENSPLGTVTA